MSQKKYAITLGKYLFEQLDPIFGFSNKVKQKVNTKINSIVGEENIQIINNNKAKLEKYYADYQEIQNKAKQFQDPEQRKTFVKEELVKLSQTEDTKILQNKLKSKCPTDRNIASLKEFKSSINQTVNPNSIKGITKAEEQLKTVSDIIPTLEILIEIIKVAPLPTAPAPITTGFIATLITKLDDAQEGLEASNSIVEQTKGSIGLITNQFKSIADKLDILDLLLVFCSIENGIDVGNISPNFSNIVDEPPSPNNDINVSNFNYDGYNISILSEEGQTTKLIKRFARVTNSKKEFVLNTTATYGSDNNSIIKEAKLEIDKLNLKKEQQL